MNIQFYKMKRTLLLSLIIVTILSAFIIRNEEIIQSSSEKTSSRYYIVSKSELLEAGDATPIVVRALEICKAEGYDGIKFPKGTYHFYPELAPDYYTSITNNDNGLKRTPFPLFDFLDSGRCTPSV